MVFSLSLAQIFAQDYEIREAPFNSKEADFSATYNGNEIVFCSTRAKKQLSFSDDSLTTFYTDLYYVKTKSDGTYTNPEPLRGKVNTILNEGQATFSTDGSVMYYTANLKVAPGGKTKKTQEYLLGLFKAIKIGDDWIPQDPFPYNSLNGKFSIAHPCLSSDNQTLYFSSNMPGGKGGSDVYFCRWENGAWGAPQNVGSEVNTKGNEFFPFINEFGTLFFSSDARSDSEGMDIYYSEMEDGEYKEVTRLNETINTEYDDFAYFEINGQNKGILSSNRIDDNDNLFLFNKYSRDFTDCIENGTRQLCYAVKDLNLAELTDLPLKYKWDMGDGTIIYGKEVEYCYTQTGDFHVTLCVIDTLTKVVFAAVSETDIRIDSKSMPYIESTDTVYINKSFDFIVDLEEFVDFEVKDITWELSDGAKFKGASGTHNITSIGLNQLKCSISGKKKSNGVVPRICVYKNIYVTDDSLYEFETEPITCCRPDQPKVIYMETNDSEGIRDSTALSYKLVLAKSDTALTLANSAFKKVTRKVIEYREPDSYVYCVDQASTWKELLPQYKELKKLGITELTVVQIPEEHVGVELNAESNVKSKEEIAPLKQDDVSDSENIAIAENQISTAQIADKTTVGDEITTEAQSLDSETKSAPKESKENQILPMISTSTDIISVDDYSILIIESDEQLQGQESGFDKLDDEVTEVIKDGKYQYYISAGSDTAAMNKKLQDVQNAGFKNARIVNWKPISGHVITKTGELITDVAPQKAKQYYQVRTESQKERIPLNNPMFKNIQTNITEIQDGELYSYVLMNTDKKEAALELLDHYNLSGEITAIIDSSSLDDFSSKIVQSGRYIAPKNADKLNIEFSKLSDIKFEYNSDEILEESYATLNYIAAMLKLEEDFSLKINAHTCSIGGATFNQTLSEKRAASVVQYFKKKGISESKLISKGYGLSKPASTNMTERGRAANRRVEFIIVFEIKQSQNNEE